MERSKPYSPFILKNENHAILCFLLHIQTQPKMIIFAGSGFSNRAYCNHPVKKGHKIPSFELHCSALDPVDLWKWDGTIQSDEQFN